MRINKIRVQNINSLRGNWEIDFTKEPFLSASLFSITGATGAGKSTLLDAITLALYNQIPRIDKVLSATIIESGKFILTRNEKECFSEVEYSCRKGSYRAKWSIGLKKKGGFRDYEMEITNLLTNEILDVKRKDIPNTNADLIGLNYEQFMRSILLAQGGFSKFLDAGHDDRAKLLEQITGTSLYRKLGIKASDIWKKKNEVVVSKRTLITEKTKRLIDDEEIEKKKTQLKGVSDKLDRLDLEKTKLSKLELIKSRIKDYETQINKNKEKLISLQKEEDEFLTENKQVLENHRRLLPYISRIQKYTERVSREIQITGLLEELKTKMKAASEDRQKLQEQIALFIGKKIQHEDTEIELLAFRNEIVEKENSRKDAGDEVLYRQERLTDMLSKSPLNKFDFDVKSESLSEEIKNQISDLSVKLADFQKTGINNETAAELKSKAAEKNDALNRLRGKVEQYSSVLGDIAHIKNCIDKDSAELVSEEIINKKDEAYRLLLNKEREQSEKVFKVNRENSESILKLRESLAENEPCLVCGSVHHPYAHEYTETISQELAILEEIKNSIKKESDELEELRKNNAITNALLKQNNQNLKEKEDELVKIKADVEDLKKIAGLAEVKTIGIIDEAIEREKRIVSSVEEFEDLCSLNIAMTDLIAELNILNQKKALLKSAEEAVTSKYKGADILKDTDGFMKKFTNVIRAMDDHVNQKSIYQSEQKNIIIEITGIKNEIFSVLQSFGYNQIGDSVPDILDQVLYEGLNNRRLQISNDIQNCKNLIEQVNTLLLDEKKNDDPEIDEDFCKVRIEVIESEIENKEELKNILAVAIKTNTEEKESIALLEKEIEEEISVNKKWFYLNQLIGDKDGKKFNTFVQYLTLSKLIKLANLHMNKLNDRYLIGLPTNAEQDDLMIIDGWMGDEARSVKSSSGGEKFLISLALALALSDLASKDVKIESLFIDEGFASLDSESLDQAISCLEQLQSTTGKSVGIISHVEELKARIQTQIKLEKSAVGFSTIKIVPEL